MKDPQQTADGAARAKPAAARAPAGPADIPDSAFAIRPPGRLGRSSMSLLSRDEPLAPTGLARHSMEPSSKQLGGSFAPGSLGSSVTGSGLSLISSNLPSVLPGRKTLSPQQLQAAMARREAALSVAKAEASRDWEPEYVPPSLVPGGFKAGALLRKSARVSRAMILKDVPLARKTKVVCTLGPACWSEEGLAGLLDAGMNVARFNFSHGDHASHQAVLDRLRKVAAAKGRQIATALDTKGPEIRTAMLKDGKDIMLTEGQEVVVVGVGADYTSWEGYVEAGTGRAVIGLSYAKLCAYLKPGNLILLSDGTITIKVLEVLDDTRLLGRVLNSHKLGQRKNCNLPGVLVDLPVLGPKDCDDVANFGARNGMDYLFASFVQSAEDVRSIRKVLADAGSPQTHVICKIESQAGLANFDAILAEADGIMVARGDLAMEIPPEKVGLAQKMMINRTQVAGKLIICATQMLESMIDAPTPSRAEMLDVANAVFDGTGAVMLSGETANGKHPALVVATMARIVAHAELAVDYLDTYHVIRANNAGVSPVSPTESLLAGVSQQALGFCADKDGDGIIELGEGCLIVVLTADGSAARLISKYRPPCPMVAVSSSEAVLRSLGGVWGVYPCLVPSLADAEAAVAAGIKAGRAQGLVQDGMKVLEVTGPGGPADASPIVTTENLGLSANSFIQKREGPRYISAFAGNVTPCRVTVAIGRELMAGGGGEPGAALVLKPRCAKVIATIGPATWTPEGMAGLLAAGVDVVRLNVKHQSTAENQRLLDMLRAVAASTWADAQAGLGLGGLVSPDAARVGIMVSIRGNEIRSARLPGSAPLAVSPGDALEFVGVGGDYISWQGGRVQAADGSSCVRVGLSYSGVGEAVKPGDVIQVDDGNLKVKVTAILSSTTVRGRALNAHALREMSLVHVPRAHASSGPGSLLGSRDREDIRLAAANQVTYLSVPFVTCAADVLQVRALLDEAGGPAVKVVAQIDTAAAIEAFDDILRVADAVMVSRTNLGMEVQPEKVALAQKWLIQKARLAARPVMVAGQLMEGMAASPRPSRPEITDVVNAVYDGADAVVLMQETSCGAFAGACVSTVGSIIADAESGLSTGQNYGFIRNWTPKPMTTIEAAASSAAAAIIDMGARLALLLTDSSAPVRMLAKYRPGVPLLVLTRTPSVAAACSAIHGALPLVVAEQQAHLDKPGLVKLGVTISRQLAGRLGTPEFRKANGVSDQLVVLSATTAEPFLDVYNFSSAQVVSLVFGDEALEMAPPTGYRGRQTLSARSTKVGLDLITAPVKSPRKTKVVCTLGPACWSEEGLAGLLDAGMNVARFNFSHGDHASHQAVLDRLRKVCQARGVPQVATLLDTKGPEIRTAMLKGGGSIDLTAGQEVVVVGVGADYTSWEGYVEAGTGRAVIGLSYPHLCRDVKPGGKILLADGSISIKVLEVLDDTRLLGTCLNSKSLGQRKNCNLPGVLVDLPVLGTQDCDDVAKFGAANGMDFVAASFVQSAEDVRFVRKVLDDAGAHHTQIISKIESWHGVTNFDDILAATDGVMVARGDLAMEVPSEKVALAQKMMITKANIAGKFVITATQMLESMTSSPLPTRAEMTDVANAVFDGTDAVMLSGETANGQWPTLAVQTMARIVTNAEVGVNSYQTFQYIRQMTDRPMDTHQAALQNVAKNVIDTDAGLVLLLASGRDSFQESLDYVRWVAKYRPRVPVLLLTKDPQLARACAAWHGVLPRLFDSLPRSAASVEVEMFLEEVLLAAVRDGLCPPGSQVVLAIQSHQPALAAAGGEGDGAGRPEVPVIRFKVAPGKMQESALTKLRRNAAASKSSGGLSTALRGGSDPALAAGANGGSAKAVLRDTEAFWQKTLSLRTTAISLEDILEDESCTRKTKVVCTLGPACWSEEGLAGLLNAGMNVARFNFSHGDHASHLEVLQRLRKVAAAKGSSVACLLDTKGPEIRTAMLKGGGPLELAQGQEVVLVAVGAEYTTWQGGMNPDTGIAELGISYDKLAQSVAPGNIVKVADGGLSIRVTEVLDTRSVRGICLNSKSVGQTKNCNLPGVHVDLPVLTSKDVADLVTFAVRHDMDFVAASFVQSGDDVRFIRQVLDRSGGAHIKVISKIENEAGLENYDDILSATDGVMVARGDLAMEVPSEKVALAQKMMITKANIAGKFVITATQMLESMTSSPLPTRAEMTDVANAVFDGTDAVMLSGETAGGAFPALAVQTMASIVQNAEVANSYYSTANFMVDHTTKPFSRLEAMAAAVCGSVTDANAQLVVTISATGEAARLVSKYRPFVPQVVVTSQPAVLRASAVHFGQYGLLAPVLDDVHSLALLAGEWAHRQGLWPGVGAVLLVSGHYEANADLMPSLQVIDVTPELAEAASHASNGCEPGAASLAGSPSADAVARALSRRLSLTTPASQQAAGAGPLPPGAPRSLARQFSKAA